MSDESARVPKGAGPQRPAVFAIVAYNQEHFIEECLRSALAQDYANLRILVSDDASPDRTSEVIQDILLDYRGPHRTQFIQQPRNIRGHHVATLVPELVRDPFIVIGNGDDVFHPDRVSRSVRTMIADGAYSATANAIVIDAEGRGDKLLMDPDENHDLSLETLCRVGTNRACFGAGLSVRRGVFGQFGRLRPGPRQIDQILVFRSTLLGGASLIREPLMKYRIHDANINLARMAELAPESQKPLIEERRRNNVVATAVAHRELLLAAKERGIGRWEYDHLDRILLESLFTKARSWSRYRASMVDEGVGIF